MVIITYYSRMLTLLELVYCLTGFVLGWISCTVLGMIAVRYCGKSHWPTSVTYEDGDKVMTPHGERVIRTCGDKQ